MFGWWREWRAKVRKDRADRLEADRKANEVIRARMAEFQKAQEEARKRLQLFRACLLTAARSDIGVVMERLHVLLLLADAKTADQMARRLTHELPTDKRIVKALEDLAVVVRMAHGDDALPKAVEADAQWMKNVLTPDVDAPPLSDEDRAWLAAARSPHTRKYVI